MKIEILKRNIVLTEKLRIHVLRQLAFALSRFGEKVVKVVVSFSNVRTRPGDVDKRCQIDVGLKRTVTAAARDGDALVAFDQAADRAGRSVARALDRERAAEEAAEEAPAIPVRRDS